jgi:hypothetical protein
MIKITKQSAENRIKYDWQLLADGQKTNFFISTIDNKFGAPREFSLVEHKGENELDSYVCGFKSVRELINVFSGIVNFKTNQ